jgi:hypothetical protein
MTYDNLKCHCEPTEGRHGNFGVEISSRKPARTIIGILLTPLSGITSFLAERVSKLPIRVRVIVEQTNTFA